MHRRAFVTTGLSLSTTLVLSGAMRLWTADKVQPPPDQHAGAATATRVVLDARFPLATRFAAAARARHLPVSFYQGDVTAVWCEVLQPHWAARGGPVTGLSTPSALECLALLARDHWYRVRERVEHPTDAPGSTHPVLMSWLIAA